MHCLNAHHNHQASDALANPSEQPCCTADVHASPCMLLLRLATLALTRSHLHVHRERTWKLKQCKRYATQISKSNLHIEARVVNREKQEQENIRKKAKWISQQVHCSLVCSNNAASGAQPCNPTALKCFRSSAHLISTVVLSLRPARSTLAAQLAPA